MGILRAEYNYQLFQARSTPMSNASSNQADKKTSAGICGILLGGLGIHKFILGYSTEGTIALVISLVGGLFTCGLSTIVMGIIGLIEGIIYLSKSDEEFVSTYITNKKGWF